MKSFNGDINISADKVQTSNKIEQVTLQGKTFIFRSPRWVQDGCYEVTRSDLLKKLNSKLVEKWANEDPGNLRKYCNSNKVGDNSDLAYQCAIRVPANDPDDAGALSVVVAAERDLLKHNSGYASSLLETVQKAEAKLELMGKGSNAASVHTSLAAAYLDLAELYAGGTRKNSDMFQVYMRKVKQHLVKVPTSEFARKVWARYRSLEQN